MITEILSLLIGKEVTVYHPRGYLIGILKLDQLNRYTVVANAGDVVFMLDEVKYCSVKQNSITIYLYL